MSSVPSIASSKLMKMKFMQRGSKSSTAGSSASASTTTTPSKTLRAIHSHTINKKNFAFFRPRKIVPHSDTLIEYCSSFMDFMDASPIFGRRVHTPQGTIQTLPSADPAPAETMPTTPPSKKPKLDPYLLPKGTDALTNYRPKSKAAAKLFARSSTETPKSS